VKKLFSGYYKPNDEEFEKLWKDATIVLDTNVLLNLYRYTKETRDRLITILESIKDKLWLPHQIALEFHTNRLKVIGDQKEAYKTITSILDDYSKKITNEINNHRRHQLINTQHLLTPVHESFSNAKAYINDISSKHPDLIENDEVLTKITNIFNNKVGEAFSEQQLASIFKSGEERYLKRIPPGYLDEKDKKGNEKFGDLIVWNQILDYAKEKKSSIILVTDDAKEDWWLKFQGRTIGPRPELTCEINTIGAKGFYIYRTDHFMERATITFNLQTPLSQGTIEEVRDLRINDNVQRRLSEKLNEERSDSIKRINAIERKLKELRENFSHLKEEEAFLIHNEMIMDERDTDLQKRDLEDPMYIRERHQMSAMRNSITNQITRTRIHIKALNDELNMHHQKMDRINSIAEHKGWNNLNGLSTSIGIGFSKPD